jgi:hypothetical protein
MTDTRQVEFDAKIRAIRNDYPDFYIEYWSPTDVDQIISEESDGLPAGIDREDAINEVMEILRDSHDASCGTSWENLGWAFREAVDRLKAGWAHREALEVLEAK